MAPVVGPTLAHVGGPDHEMCDTGTYFVIASRAAIRLDGA
jgi:hypothetical protein